MGRLDSRIAIVTGASRGIGRAIAVELAREGAKVALNYQSSEAMAQEVADEIRKAGGECMLAKSNVADAEQARAMVKSVVQKWARLDIMVNNAGITRDKSIRKMTDQDWMDVIQTNLNAVFFCTTAAMQPMIEQKYGRIVNISSMNGQTCAFGSGELQCEQGRHHRVHQDGGAGTGPLGRHGQRGGAGLYAHRHAGQGTGGRGQPHVALHLTPEASFFSDDLDLSNSQAVEEVADAMAQQ